MLAGGEAQRLPRKLELAVDGEPLVVGAFRRFCGDFTVAVSLAIPLPETIMKQLHGNLIYDRHHRRGPLGGMLTACETLACDPIGFVAADLPLVNAKVLRTLRDAWQGDDEAVVASHGDRLEPLVGWYDRNALLREGRMALQRNDVAVRNVVQRLRMRMVAMPSGLFVNINTPADLKAFRSTGTKRRELCR